MRLNKFLLASLAGLSMITACAATVPVQVSGGVLTSPAGMTLYAFDKHAPDSGKSACNGECAAKWPPLIAAASDKASGH